MMELEIRMGQAIYRVFGCSVILLVGLQILPSWAAEPPAEEHPEIVRADLESGSDPEAGTASNAFPATMAGTIEALKQQVELQQKQLEKLQSALSQLQIEFNKARSAAATELTEAPASASTSSPVMPAQAPFMRPVSNTSASADPPVADSRQSGRSAGQAVAATPELPPVLRGFKPIGTFYVSYQAGRQYAGLPNRTTNYDSFQLKRGYFGADVDITSHLTARFVSDVTLDSLGDVKLRAKYLYGKFHWKGNKTITSPYMEFGLTHMPWLDFEEAMNGFRMQDTMFLERNSIFNSADVGVMVGSDLGGSLSSDYKSKVNGHYAGKYGSWQAAVYNGGGYHSREQNTNKVFEGRLSIRPVPGFLPGLQFTALGVLGKGNQPVIDGVDPPDWKVFNGMVSYESERFTFTGQGYFGTGNQAGTAVSLDGTAADQQGFSLFAAAHIPTSRIGGKITILGRMDEFNSNTQIYNDIKRLYIAGVAWHFYKSNTWLFDYQRTNHSISTIPGEDRAQLTLQVVF
jgi:hypothetical protein